MSFLYWFQLGVCEAIRCHSEQKPGLILPLQRRTKGCPGSEWVTAPAPPAQFCVKLLLKVFKDFHPPSSHSPGKWKTFEFLSQERKLLKWKQMTVPCSFLKRREKKCGFSPPLLFLIIRNRVKNPGLRNQMKGKFVPPASCVLISAYNATSLTQRMRGLPGGDAQEHRMMSSQGRCTWRTQKTEIQRRMWNGNRNSVSLPIPLSSRISTENKSLLGVRSEWEILLGVDFFICD